MVAENKTPLSFLLSPHQVCAVQHVDVCMFSNGKFKNIVAEETISEPLGPDTRFNRIFELVPVRTPTKNWIAVEGALFNSSAAASSEAANSLCEHTRLAPSSPPELRAAEDRNVFAIYVSYYVKVKLTLSGMGGELSLKLPFLLGEVDEDTEQDECVAANKSSRSDNNGGGEGGGVVLPKSPRRLLVCPESQCEVISELCEMSLSNNNLSTDPRTVPSVRDKNGDTAIDSSGTLDNGLLGKCDVVRPLRDNDKANEDDDDENSVPVISVATVQVHAPSGSGLLSK